MEAITLYSTEVNFTKYQKQIIHKFMFNEIDELLHEKRNCFIHKLNIFLIKFITCPEFLSSRSKL